MLFDKRSFLPPLPANVRNHSSFALHPTYHNIGQLPLVVGYRVTVHYRFTETKDFGILEPYLMPPAAKIYSDALAKVYNKDMAITTEEMKLLGVDKCKTSGAGGYLRLPLSQVFSDKAGCNIYAPDEDYMPCEVRSRKGAFGYGYVTIMSIG